MRVLRHRAAQQSGKPVRNRTASKGVWLKLALTDKELCHRRENAYLVCKTLASLGDWFMHDDGSQWRAVAGNRKSARDSGDPNNG